MNVSEKDKYKYKHKTKTNTDLVLSEDGLAVNVCEHTSLCPPQEASCQLSNDQFDHLYTANTCYLVVGIQTLKYVWLVHWVLQSSQAPLNLSNNHLRQCLLPYIVHICVISFSQYQLFLFVLTLFGIDTCPLVLAMQHLLD